jgi:hypothetical protein
MVEYESPWIEVEDDNGDMQLVLDGQLAVIAFVPTAVMSMCMQLHTYADAQAIEDASEIDAARWLRDRLTEWIEQEEKAQSRAAMFLPPGVIRK